MSYKQQMRWTKKHPKGTNQPIVMSAHSGPWPSENWFCSVCLLRVGTWGCECKDATRKYLTQEQANEIQEKNKGD